MNAIFAIVLVAAFVVVILRAEGTRPFGLVMIGVLCILVGLRAGTLVTSDAMAPLTGTALLAQDTTADTAASDDDAQDAGETASDAEAAPDGADAGASADDADDAEPQDAAEETAADEDPAESDDADAGDAPPATFERITNVAYPDRGSDTPEWLEGKAWSDGDVYFVPVFSKLEPTSQESERALLERVRQATGDYINELLKSKHAAMLVRYDVDRRLDALVHGEFDERVDTSYGPMHQSHVLLGFDNEFREDVFTKWDQVKATSRLMQTALGAGVVLLLLGTMFGYFRLDTATRGYYTGRLQFAAAAAILAVVAAGVLFANYIPWM